MHKAWCALKDYHSSVAERKILSLFDTDPARAETFSLRRDEVLFDWSKTNIDSHAAALLFALAREADVEAQRDAMFAGAKINTTEGRAVLHTALRAGPEAKIMVDGADVMDMVRAELAHMARFARDLRSGRFVGQGGKITDVVNIGIGGSDLGPVMAVAALAPYHDGPRVHFVSNVDGAHIHDTLAPLDPTTTLIVVASKTFTTIETMTNAAAARAWMGRVVADPVAQFAAVSTATEATDAYGIPAERVFGFGDWVGGRYSMWGPIGLSIMLAIGPVAFDEMLAGGRAMDAHFRAAPLEENLPVILALVGVWHHQICGYATRAVLPYAQRLSRLPAYLQQLEMESNGKSVAMDGSPLGMVAGPVVWGEPGTNGQHAFFQLLHQGASVVPCEFLLCREGHEPDLAHHQRLLAANCLAQSAALLRGRSLEAAREILRARGLGDGPELERQAAHRVFPGNRPSTTLLLPKLTPFTLGQVVALYEHRVFVEGLILGINSFDQWGVELGKELALAIEPILGGRAAAARKDGSTLKLLDYLME